MSTDPTLPPPNFPPPNFPTVFADSVLSIANSAESVKFYLARHNPEYAGLGRVETHAILQVIMPISGFTAMAAFFELAMKNYLASGFIKQEDLDMYRAQLSELQFHHRQK